MDWRRAKSVLILAFLMLNILLSSQLWLEWKERLNTSVDWTSLPPETRAEMQEKNIRFLVEAKIPTETPMMREMIYRFRSQAAASGALREIKINSPPETRVVFVEDELKEALGNEIPDLALYAFDDLISSQGVFVFNRMVGNFPIFKITLNLHYSDQRIQSYSQALVDVWPALDTKEQQVLPASKAIANLIERNLPANSTIKEIHLGYYGQYFPDAESQVVSPTWRVLLESGEIYYMNAFSAEVVIEKGNG